MPLGFVCIRLQLDLEMKKTIFNMYFSYPFRRTLPASSWNATNANG